jgi:AhpD family alkylhydroperoxidase
MVPNMYANMANAPGLLETYMSGYAAFRAESGFDATEQELVFLVISEWNDCTYCMAAHSVVADLSKVPTSVTDAIRSDGVLDDPRLSALASFTRVLMETRGRPTQSDVDGFVAAGYTEQHVLYLVLALALKTMSNYSNHLFDTPLDRAFQSREWHR